MTDKKETTVRLITTVAKVIIFFVGWAILASVIPIPDSSNPAVWRFFAELIPFFCIAAMTALFLVIERRKITLHMTAKPLHTIVLSCVLGVAWIGVSVGILTILGVVRIAGVNQIEALWLWMLSAFVNTVMQELLVRGYLYQMIKKNFNTVASAIVSTALFTLAHGGAFEAGVIPVLNVLTMSLFMTALLEYTGTLCAPICVHFLWNGIGAILLGGVSLADDYPHLLNMAFDGNVLLSGGACKIEGSIVVLIFNVAFALEIVWALRKKSIRKSC